MKVNKRLSARAQERRHRVHARRLNLQRQQVWRRRELPFEVEKVIKFRIQKNFRVKLTVLKHFTDDEYALINDDLKKKLKADVHQINNSINSMTVKIGRKFDFYINIDATTILDMMDLPGKVNDWPSVAEFARLDHNFEMTNIFELIQGNGFTIESIDII